MRALAIGIVLLVAVFVADQFISFRVLSATFVGTLKSPSSDAPTSQHETKKSSNSGDKRNNSRSDDTTNNNSSLYLKSIRKWGCDRTETPFVFVHIHKAGGGSIKGRIAAGSVGFNTTKQRPFHADGSYYPITNDTSARLCWSCFRHRRPSNEASYEGTDMCHASTPMGRAIACPRTINFELEKCPEPSETCHLVYVGHNVFGSEMHWLPTPFLENWWSTLPIRENQVGNYYKNNSTVSHLWDKRLLPTKDTSWCAPNGTRKPLFSKTRFYVEYYNECSLPLQAQADQAAIDTIASSSLYSSSSIQRQDDYDGPAVVSSWSPLYASVPVLRATVVRDPFSWLVSKFRWHKGAKIDQIEPNKSLTCDDLDSAILYNFTRPLKLNSRSTIRGWMTRMSLEYLMWLCGEDCLVRYGKGESTLEELALQAEGNLRHGFAVVGILDNVNVFYEMLSARIAYMDTSLNPDYHWKNHATIKGHDNCTALFLDPAFQNKLLALSPELRVIHHLYQVALEVNKFQLEELRSCSPRMESFLSNQTYN